MLTFLSLLTKSTRGFQYDAFLSLSKFNNCCVLSLLKVGRDQQQVASAVERAKQVTELNAVIGVNIDATFFIFLFQNRCYGFAGY